MDKCAGCGTVAPGYYQSIPILRCSQKKCELCKFNLNKMCYACRDLIAIPCVKNIPISNDISVNIKNLIYNKNKRSFRVICRGDIVRIGKEINGLNLLYAARPVHGIFFKLQLVERPLTNYLMKYTNIPIWDEMRNDNNSYISVIARDIHTLIREYLLLKGCRWLN